MSRILAVAQKLLMLWAVVLAVYLYGYYSVRHDWFPAPQIATAVRTAKELNGRREGRVTFPYRRSSEKRLVVMHDPGKMQPGLTLVAGVGPKGTLFARLIEPDGRVEHQWDLSSFKLWPKLEHVLPEDRPKEAPGTHVHGMVLDPNGDLTFNYEYLGMMKLDICGRPKWRVKEWTNHKIIEDAEGNYWTLAYHALDKAPEFVEDVKTPIMDHYVLKVSHEGKLLRRISLFDLLQRNGYSSLLASSRVSYSNQKFDTLHPNSLEFFPADVESDYFAPGDLMVSLRNPNALIVFDPKTLVIKHRISGKFLGQHDPHFEGGSAITLFDNNNLSYETDESSSRIIRHDMTDGQETVIFEGNSEHPFFTGIMGVQQPLENGNRLLTEATRGRVLEIDGDGQLVWEYFNQTGPGVLGLVDQARRIPPDVMTVAKLKELTRTCPK